MIEIPNFNTLDIKHIVCDYNGTIAKDGVLLDEVSKRLERLSKSYQIHIITADTFESVEKQLEDLPLSVKILVGDDHTQEKSDFVRDLGASHCVAIGNGNNDKAMLTLAELGITVIGHEGCAKDALLSADLVCTKVTDALDALLYTRRLVASLRR